MNTADTVIAAAAAARHGIVTRAQLLQLGVTAREVDWRVERRLLLGVHQGVYRHAAAPWTPKGGLLAAVLACGPHAVAHRSAATLHRLRDVPPWRPEVTIPSTSLSLCHGVPRHRSDLLQPLDTTSIDRIPVTTLPRTLLDLGAVVPFEVVEKAAQDAMITSAVSAVELICVLERVGRGRRGTAALRAVVRSSLPPEGIESRLELDLLRLVERCPVPAPVLQHPIVVDGRCFRLDAAWPDLLVAVEGDGRRWHSTRDELERDLTRARSITSAGWRHYRYGWTDVHQRAPTVQAEITGVVTRTRARAA